jgi:glycosyltransferase involved in cell wall biosynthesis
MAFNLAFYYHVPIISENDNLFCPGYLGVFIDALAQEVDELVLLMHERETKQSSDYLLKQKNIRFVSLGKKPTAWIRVLFSESILADGLNQIKHCDTLLVRAPSPFAPFFKKHLKATKLAYLVVGDYQEVAKTIKLNSLRSLLVKSFLLVNNNLLERQLKTNLVIVNSQALFEKYKNSCESIHIVNTTTLSEKDFYIREDTCNGEKINILFTGRISFEKGLKELFYAFKELTRKFKNLHLNIVGWEDDLGKPVERKLRLMSETLKISGKVTFHGFKNIGSELNDVYKSSDIYVIPSYNEGFPRTIWEAMANSLPVVSTNVGSIPLFLKNNYSALLIKPKNTEDIVSSVTKLINNSDLRKTLIAKGIELSKEVTLDKQTKKLINLLKKC